MLERGARIVLIRPGARSRASWARARSPCPSSTRSGSWWPRPTSWSACTPRTAATSATPTSGKGSRDGEMTPFKGGSGFAAIIGHQGRPDHRHRRLAHRARAVQPVPDAAVRPGRERQQLGPPAPRATWSTPTHPRPKSFDEDPVEVFKRNIYVHPFHEEDPMGLIELLGRRPRAVRLGLPAPRGHGRPAQLRRRAGGPPRRRHPQGHGWQPEPAHGLRNRRLSRALWSTVLTAMWRSRTG